MLRVLLHQLFIQRKAIYGTVKQATRPSIFFVRNDTERRLPTFPIISEVDAHRIILLALLQHRHLWKDDTVSIVKFEEA